MVVRSHTSILLKWLTSARASSQHRVRVRVCCLHHSGELASAIPIFRLSTFACVPCESLPDTASHPARRSSCWQHKGLPPSRTSSIASHTVAVPAGHALCIGASREPPMT